MDNIVQKVIPIEQLGLSVRSYNCLKRNDIHDTSDLFELSREQLSNIKNMGKTSVDEVIETMRKFVSGELDENVINRYEKSDYKKVTVLHYIAEETLIKEVSNILFLNHDGLYEEDIPIDELQFSKRTQGTLIRAERKSACQIINMKYSELRELNGMGAKSLNEIISKLSEIILIRYSENNEDKMLDEYLELLSKDFADYVDDKVRLQLLGSIKTTLLKMDSSKYMNTEIGILDNISLLRVLYEENTTKKIMQTVVLSLLKNRTATYLFIKDKMPQTFILSGKFSEMMERMLHTKKIVDTEDGYSIYYPSVLECIDLMDNDKMGEALRCRLQGKTLEETGNELGITRERVRQIVKKAVEKLPKVRESQYKYWFESYDLSKEDFISIFNLTEESYNYMNIVYENNDTKTIEDIFSDVYVTDGIAQRAKKALKKYNVLIDGEYVPLKRDVVTKKLLKLHHSSKECSISDFYIFYNAFLVENGIDTNEKMLYASEHALEARLADCDYILMKYGRKVRYYDIREYDIQKLFVELGLESFNGLEISTLKLFNSNTDLMEEYSIQDEYELHNLMKKCEEKLPDVGVKLGRMPFITIGNANRAKQVEDFLYRLAPIGLYEFGAAYEEEYGVKSETVLANFVQYIDKYYYNSMFTVNQKELNSVEYAELQMLLTEDFYFISDIEVIYSQAFPVGDVAKINSYNLKLLGFLVYVDYAVRSKYETADKYFRSILQCRDEIDIKCMDRRMCYNQTFRKVLDDLRSDYELLEIEPSKYISYERFLRTAPGITKKELKQYSIIIPQSTSDRYFTIKSVRDMGVSTPIDDLGYSDWFYGALLRANKVVRYCKMAGGFLFSHENRQITRGDFFTYIVESFGQIAINEFMRYIENKYGLIFDRYDIPTVINNTSMYYSPVTEKIYASKEIYYSKGVDNSAIGGKEISSPIHAETELQPYYASTIEPDTFITIAVDVKEQITEEVSLQKETEIEIQNIDVERLEEILCMFARGFRIGSSLEAKKFRRYYEETYEETLEMSDFQLETILSRMGVIYENRIYSTKTIMDDYVAKKVDKYIEEMFDTGKSAIYYASIYQEFEIEFQHQQVYSIEMLKCYLEHMYREKYYMKRSFITNNPEAEVNPVDELNQCLISNQRSMSFEEMTRELPHIPLDRIKNVLATNAVFIRDARGSYFSADIVQFEDDELRQIELLIRDSIEVNGFMAGNKMLEMIEEKYPVIFDKLLQFQNIGKRDCISYWLRDRFSFNGNIISEYGKSYKMQDVYALYCQRHSYFTMDMLNALKIELDTTIYFDAIYDNSLRISEDEFVSKDQACFNILDTDKAIDKFCQGDYIALSEIQQFALFPDAGFQWNTYLLEHYVYAYSEEYMLFHTATFNAKAAGIIVRRSSGFKTFEDVVADALARSGIELNEETALIYLYEHNYIARKKVSSIEQIIVKAKRLREKR